jgi:hypothetical protein
MQGWTHSVAEQPNHVLSLSLGIAILMSLPREKCPSISAIHHSIPGLRYNATSSLIFLDKPSVPKMDFLRTVCNFNKYITKTGALQLGIEVFESIPIGTHVKGDTESFAQYAVIPSDALYSKQRALSFDQPAGLPIASCTALALLDTVGLK